MTNFYCVYLIKCQDKKGRISYYCGYTNNPKRRLKEHQEGKGAKYTAMRTILGMRVLFYYPSEKEAIHAERFIKENYSPGKKQQCYDYSEMKEVEVK